LHIPTRKIAQVKCAKLHGLPNLPCYPEEGQAGTAVVAQDLTPSLTAVSARHRLSLP